MDYARVSLVLIRLLVTGLGLTYTVHKLLGGEAFPLYLINSRQIDEGTTNFPVNTAPAFAYGLISFLAIVSTYIIVRTLWVWVTETKRFRVPIPTAPRDVQAALILSCIAFVHYFFIGLLSDVRWIWALILALITGILSWYEVTQSNAHDIR